MDYTTFKQKQQVFLNGLWPERIVSLNELKNEGDNIFRMNEYEMQATDSFTQTFDQLLGIKGRLTKKVLNASGETGLSNFRNYMNVADGISNATKVLIIASPQNHTLVSIHPIVDKYIQPQLFLDFAEMMADETGYNIENMKYSIGEAPHITLSFSSPNPQQTVFGVGEEFLTDGFFLDWKPDTVQIGHYYKRLVCSNGSFVIDQRHDSHTHRLETDDMKKMIDLIKLSKFTEEGIEKFGLMIKAAKSSRISLAEMRTAQRILTYNQIDETEANNLIHYNDAVKAYQDSRLYDSKKEKMLKGENTIWDVYNVLTAFASHTTMWEDHDIRRTKVMNDAVMSLLQKQPDIKTYYDIYQ